MKISCFTCKYGYEDERLGIPMCHHPKRFSDDCVNFNMYEEKEIKKSEKIVPNDLEEASEISFDEAYALTGDYVDFLAKGLKENQPRPIGPNWFCEYAKKRFIAGAEWQKEQMEETYCPRSEKWKEVEETARHEYENGWKDCKEQMMKDAVEGVVTNADGVFGYDVATFRFDDNHTYSVLISHEEKRKYGDKVRVIVLPKDD